MTKGSSRKKSRKWLGVSLWSCLMVVSFCLTCVLAQAQTAEFTQGKQNSHAMTLEIPLVNYPGRRVNMPVTLSYSSRGLWRIGYIDSIPMGSSVWRSVTEGIYAEHSTAGWTTSLDVPRVEWPKTKDVYWYTGKPYTRGPLAPWTFRSAQLFMHMPDGSTHEMRKTDTVYLDGSGNLDMTGTFWAVDGTRMRYDSAGQNTGTLYLPDGGRWVLGSSTVQFIDRNGNTLTYDVSTRVWRDTMGREIGMPWPANPGPGEYTYSLPSVNGSTKIYKFKFQSLSSVLSPNAQGLPPSLEAIGDYYLPNPSAPPTGPTGGNFPQSTSGETLFSSGYSHPDETTSSYTYVVGRGQSGSSAFNPAVLAEIELPTGQKYKFFYNINGEIDKVIYPTGGYERYQYAKVAALGSTTIPYTQASRGLISRWLSPSGTGNDEARWQYSTGINPLIVTAPDETKTETYLFSFPSSPTAENFGYQDNRHGMVKEERIFASPAQGGAMLRRTLYEYAQTSVTIPKPVPPNTFNTGSYTAHRNVRLIRQVSLILDTGGDALAKTQTYEYAQNGNEFTTGFDRTASTETHYQTVPITTAQTGLISQIPAGTTFSRVETVYLTDSAYHNRNILGFASSTTIKGVISGVLQTVAATEFDYDETALLAYGDLTSPGYIDPGTPIRGNITTLTRYVDAAKTIPVTTHTQFDQCGNPHKSVNERGFETNTEYAATYKHAFGTKTTTAIPDPLGTHGANSAFESSGTYDFNTGLPVTTTNANGQVTTFSYEDDQQVKDPLNRLRQVTRPDGSWTKYSYGDTVGNLFKLTETKQDATRTTKSYEYFDPLGRASRTFASESGNNYLATDTIYDLMGRSWKISNTYRTTTLNGVADIAHTSHWTISAYDALSRITSVTLQDGSMLQTSYQGVFTTVTDQAAKQRRQKTDAMGRIIRVDEPNSSGSLGAVDSPVQPTYYDYDTQGNIVHIAQGSSPVQHRYFKYDALGRITHERHVEQAAPFAAPDPVTGNGAWSRKLVYDESVQVGTETETYTGLLTTVSDARNITTKYRYDQLNRIYQIAYSDGTPTITNKYDQARSSYWNKGQLTEASTLAAGAIPATAQLYDYDDMGRVVHHEQMVGAQTYTMSYGFNLGGALISQTYPSGRIVSYNFDDAARLSQVSSQVSSTTTVYANQFDYTSPTGLLKSLTLGNDAVENYVYNSRSQLQSLDLTYNGTQLQHYDYKYGVYDPATNTVDVTKNNGQIAQIEGFVQAQKKWQQSFVYDKLGRFSSGREFRGDNNQQSYLANYEYDVFGNRYQKQAQNSTNPFPQVWVEDGQIDSNTNRFNTGSGLSYDAAGNITSDSKFRNRKFEYDATNRQKQSRNLDNSGPVDSVFDAGGRRVATQVAGALTSVLVYDVLGKLVAEYNSNTVLGGTQYTFTDPQGTPRTTTNNQGTVIARHDYLPFGEDIPNSVGLRASTPGYGGTDAARQRYAAMESDAATGLAHTLWRKYDCLSARWTSPDPYGGSMKLTEPQSFNRYTYVNNDPVNHVDPTGLALADIGIYQTQNAAVVVVVHRIQANLIRNHVSQRSGTGITNGRAAQQVALNRAINAGVEKHGLKFLPATAPAAAPAAGTAAPSPAIVPCDVVISAGRNRAIVAVALGEGTPFLRWRGNVSSPTTQFAKEQDGGMLGVLTEQDYREEAYYMASVVINRFNGGGYADYDAVVNENNGRVFLGIHDGWNRINDLGQNGSEYCERARYVIDSLNYIDRQGGTNNNFLYWRGVEQNELRGNRRPFRQGDQRAANTDFMHMDPTSDAYSRLPYLTNNGWRVPRR